MKDFLNMYTELIESNHEEIGKVSLKFSQLYYLFYFYLKISTHGN